MNTQKRKPKRRNKWATPIGAEREFEKALRRVARTVGDLITMSMPEAPPYATNDNHSGLTLDADPNAWTEWQRRIYSQLTEYEKALVPWAETITKRMLNRVDNDSRRAFESSSKEISKGLRGVLAKEAAGAKMLQLQAAQVESIKKIPRQAAERAQKLAREVMVSGRRFEDIVQDIKDSGKVSAGRARVIARTETAKANATLTQARAQSVGSGGYYWRTMEDEAVRESHQEMADRSDAGEIFDWDSPPLLSDGESHHPGEFPNCFIGSEKVSLLNGCSTLLRHHYSGDVVTISDSAGGNITATPNHPIMTIRGWIPMEALNTRDYILQIIDNRSIVQSNKNNLMTTFDDLYAALSVINRGKCKIVSGGAFNLHNYIPNGNVDSIRPDAFLLDDTVSEVFKALRNFSFTISDSAVVNIGAFCCNSYVLESNVTRFFNQIAALCCAHVEHADCVSFRSCAPDNIIFYEDVCDTFSATHMLFRQCQFANTRSVLINNTKLRQVCALIESCGGSVFYHDTPSAQILREIVRITANTTSGILDRGSITYKLLRVVDKSLSNFSGHVFTLESLCGYYTTGESAIASKNCRCYAEPVLPDLESL